MASRFLDLAAMAVWSVAALVAVLSEGPTWLTALLGLPLVLLLPGLAALALSHPDREPAARPRTMAVPERLAWGVLLSVLATLIVGFSWHMGSGLTRVGVTASLVAITLVLTGLAAVVRYVETDPRPAAGRVRRGWAEWASMALVLALAGAVAVVAVDLGASAADRSHSVLALVDPAPLLCQPFEWRDGALRHASGRACPPQANVTVGVANREGRTMAYRVVAAWDTTAGAAVPASVFMDESFTLEPQGPDGLAFQWVAELDLPPPPPGQPSYLKVFLFKDGSGEPSLHLQLRVITP